MGRKVVGRRAAGVGRRAAGQKVLAADQCAQVAGGAGIPKEADRTAAGPGAGRQRAGWGGDRRGPTCPPRLASDYSIEHDRAMMSAKRAMAATG